MEPILFAVIAAFGLLVGSFLNVLMYRIPLGEEFVKTPSHCPSCGKRLGASELVPLFSWVVQGGKCKACKAPISAQYPIIEASNAALWIICAFVVGFTPKLPLYCLLMSALLTISVIDGRTRIIPLGMNVFIAILGLGMLTFSLIWPGLMWYEHLIGLAAVSVPLFIIIMMTDGKALGGGDMKLMAAAGLFLGWKGALLAFFAGCVFGSVVHIVRMVATKADHKLALGPYLAAGIALSALFGDAMITQYLTMYN